MKPATFKVRIQEGNLEDYPTPSRKEQIAAVGHAITPAAWFKRYQKGKRRFLVVIIDEAARRSRSVYSPPFSARASAARKHALSAVLLAVGDQIARKV